MNFYIDEFTNAKIEQAWGELITKHPAIALRTLDCAWINSDVMEAGRCRNTGALDPGGVINGNDDLYEYNASTKQYEGLIFPNRKLGTEYWGARQNRQYLYGFIQAGFDLLVVDKRGRGISGSVNPYNSAEMVEDIFRMLDQMESGVGLTVLTPDGQLLQGDHTAGLLLRDRPAG